MAELTRMVGAYGSFSGELVPRPDPAAKDHRVRRSYRRLGASTLAAVSAVLALTGCLSVRDGEELAGDIAMEQAALLHDGLGYRNRIRDAEHIAATEFPEPVQDPGRTIQRSPLRWSGKTTGSEQATIDVRFVVTVDEQPPAGLGDAGISAGQATRCFRYVLQLYRYTEHHEIDCPAIATPAVPTASPIPELPDDARERLSTALRKATPATLDTVVRAAFPEPYVTVDTARHQGALVAAVGVPAERDCLLLVRTPGGAIEAPGYDRIQLEPGEMGCSTGLFISPPR